jgi:hypothetical protein
MLYGGLVHMAIAQGSHSRPSPLSDAEHRHRRLTWDFDARRWLAIAGGEWISDLQSPVHRFDSGRRLHRSGRYRGPPQRAVWTFSDQSGVASSDSTIAVTLLRPRPDTSASCRIEAPAL